ncbi:MAG: hypothetical protein H6559_28260 [Lewinellaceae bacterium]|nr:hypothetical protein [Lewinellaceae bacterium]
MTHWALSEAWLQALGWALFHSIWQLSLIAFLGWAFLRGMGHRLAVSRQYGFVVLLIALSALLFAGTAGVQFSRFLKPAPAAETPAIAIDPAAAGAAVRLPQNDSELWQHVLSNHLESNMIWIVMATRLRLDTPCLLHTLGLDSARLSPFCCPTLDG